MSSFSSQIIEVPTAERPPVERNERGEPQYGDSGIAAVGARDLTLAEAVDHLLVFRPGESDPVAVQVPLAALEGHPGLEPLLLSGTQIPIEPEPVVQIPAPVWEEHAEQTVGIWLPERDAAGLDRALAIAARELKFAQREVDRATSMRNWLIVIGTRGLGRKRRAIADAGDVSAARVQQVNDDPPPGALEFVRVASLVAGLLGESPCPREDVLGPREVDRDELDEVLDAMLAAGLLEEVPEGVQLSDDGLSLGGFGELSSAARRRRKRSGDGERAGDADW